MELLELIKSGVQFGHQTWRCNPKMRPYIWGQKQGIHLIDVAKTAWQLDRAAAFLESVAQEGKSIVWCATKKAAQTSINAVFERTSCPIVPHRWIGGTFTNHTQVRKSVTKLSYLEEIIAKTNQSSQSTQPFQASLLTKKEQSVLQKKIERITKNVGGIRKLSWPVGALVVIDVKKEHVAISEAIATGIPIVALVDTNSDPSGIPYVIPGNDDAPRSIECIVNYLIEAVLRGKKFASEKPKDVLVNETGQNVSIDDVIERALGSVEDDSFAVEKDGKTKAKVIVKRNKRAGNQNH